MQDFRFSGRLGRRQFNTWLGGAAASLAVPAVHAAPSVQVEVLHSFGSPPRAKLASAYPSSPLLRAADGAFYGTTAAGGRANNGTIFRIDEQGTKEVLYAFPANSGRHGRMPRGPLVQMADGFIYGATAYPPTGYSDLVWSTIFRIDAAGRFDTVAIISYTYTGLRLGPDGSFYFVSPVYDRVQRYTLGGQQELLFEFNDTVWATLGTDLRALTVGPDGWLYLTLAQAGLNGGGMLHRLSLDGTQIVTLHAPDFSTAPEGRYPIAPLAPASDGLYYGSMYYPSAEVPSAGSLFRVSSGGEFELLHALDGREGSQISMQLVQASDGHLYGVTNGRSDSTAPQTVFRLTLGGEFKVVHTLAKGKIGRWGECLDIISAADGRLLLLMGSGGAYDQGALISLTGVLGMP